LKETVATANAEVVEAPAVEEPAEEMVAPTVDKPAAEVGVTTAASASSVEPDKSLATTPPAASLHEDAEVVEVPVVEGPAERMEVTPTLDKPAAEVGVTAAASTSSAEANKSLATRFPSASLHGVLRVPPSASQFLDDIEKNAEEHMQNVKLLQETVEVSLYFFCEIFDSLEARSTHPVGVAPEFLVGCLKSA